MLADKTYGRVTRALVERNKTQLLHLLETDVTLLSQERGPWGETAFHFAVLWPDGLKLLVGYAGSMARSLIDSEADIGCSPLDLAMKLHRFDSVLVLIEAKATITFHHFFDLEYIILEILSCPHLPLTTEKEIMRILIETFANRRRQLLDLALRELPPQDIALLNLHHKEILDCEAYWIIELFKARGVAYPPHLDDRDHCYIDRPSMPRDPDQRIQYIIKMCNEDHSESIYTRFNLDHAMAQIFWDSGFRQISDTSLFYLRIPNSFGYLAPENYLVSLIEGIAWFERHGVDMMTLMPSNFIRRQNTHEAATQLISIIHWVAYLIAMMLHEFPSNQLSQDEERYICHIISETVNDSCKCFCLASERGCIPASVFVKGAWNGYGHHQYDELHGPDVSNGPQGYERQPLNPLVFSGILHGVTRGIALRMIRVMTFEMLGMKHTCCRYLQRHWNDPPDIYCMDTDEAKEIREEDLLTKQHLDKLMSEFTTSYGLDTSFSQFVKDVWMPRMEAWKQETDELTDEDRKRWQDIGVILDDS